jgi:hypothetical protein
MNLEKHMSDRGALIIGSAIVIAAIIVALSHHYVPWSPNTAIDCWTGNYKIEVPGQNLEK